ncbi:MAG: DUF4390 domain-containing protein [Acidobacteriota bacterium]|nr:DUF4390 domain-containing protein [Acidobacteriota bacterium]
MIRSVCIGTLWILTVAAPGDGKAEGHEGPVVTNLEVARHDGDVSVSYDIVRGVTEEDLTRVHSGIPLKFQHRAEIVGKRVMGIFPRKTLARTVVTTRVEYDTLTKRYELSREVRGKDWPKDSTPPDHTDIKTTSSLEEMKAWMTTLDEVPLPDPPDIAERVKIKVRSELGKKFVMMIFPSIRTTSAETWMEP